MVSPYEKKSLGKKKSLGQDKYFPLIIGENFLKNPDFGRIRIAQIKPLNDNFFDQFRRQNSNIWIFTAKK